MISIIIPTLNEEGFIAQTLAPLKAGLRHTEHEVIISDGASADKTVEIARRFADTVVVEPEPLKRNIARGRNLGARAAKGEFLVFMDADTSLADPDAFFSTALARFHEDPRLVGLTAPLKVLPEMETFGDKFFFGVVNVINTFFNNVVHTGGASGEFQMIRASAFRKLGGYSEHLVAAEDVDMFSRLAKEGRTRMERSLLVYHTGRRGHIVGWPKVLAAWCGNGLCYMLFNRSLSGEWKPVRTKSDVR